MRLGDVVVALADTGVGSVEDLLGINLGKRTTLPFAAGERSDLPITIGAVSAS